MFDLYVFKLEARYVDCLPHFHMSQDTLRKLALISVLHLINVIPFTNDPVRFYFVFVSISFTALPLPNKSFSRIVYTEQLIKDVRLLLLKFPRLWPSVVWMPWLSCPEEEFTSPSSFSQLRIDTPSKYTSSITCWHEYSWDVFYDVTLRFRGMDKNVKCLNSFQCHRLLIQTVVV